MDEVTAEFRAPHAYVVMDGATARLRRHGRGYCRVQAPHAYVIMDEATADQRQISGEYMYHIDFLGTINPVN